jgi:hypothetical protein
MQKSATGKVHGGLSLCRPQERRADYPIFRGAKLTSAGDCQWGILICCLQRSRLHRSRSAARRALSSSPAIVRAPRPGSAFGAQRKGTCEFPLKQTIRDRHMPRKTTRPIKMICPSPFGSNRSGLCRKRNTPCKFAALASPVAKHTRSSRMAWQIAGRGPDRARAPD